MVFPRSSPIWIFRSQTSFSSLTISFFAFFSCISIIPSANSAIGML
ncbi:Uncharacterised protein [Mycobacteroides abscessus subsp. abscessus]|nr:Uncharacterised protein [Mycobacteroides abscessus subsp. abscessus]